MHCLLNQLKTVYTVQEFIDDILAEHPDKEGEFNIFSTHGEFQYGFEPYVLYANGHIVYEHIMSDAHFESDVMFVHLETHPIDKTWAKYTIYI